MNFTPPPYPKILYLLNDPGKGKFFKAFGFNKDNWQLLQAAILQMAVRNQSFMAFRRATMHGKEYEIIGDIETPAGRNVNLKAGWWLDPGQTNQFRFVTAYPNNLPPQG